MGTPRWWEILLPASSRSAEYARLDPGRVRRSICRALVTVCQLQPSRPGPSVSSLGPGQSLSQAAPKSLDQLPHALDHEGWWSVFESLRARQFLALIRALARLSTAAKSLESSGLRVWIPLGRPIESDARDLSFAESDARVSWSQMPGVSACLQICLGRQCPDCQSEGPGRLLYFVSRSALASKPGAKPTNLPPSRDAGRRLALLIVTGAQAGASADLDAGILPGNRGWSY